MTGWKRLARGFTVVELLIVIVVIAVLATILVVGYSAVQNNAHDAAVKADLQKIDDAMKQYALDHNGIFPDTPSEMASLGLKLNFPSYYTGNKANVYVCVNANDTEYAVVAMAKSGNRFMVKSESGISDYTGGITWNPTTANWPTTCASIDPDYVSPSSLTGMEYDQWVSWTGVESITNLFANPNIETSTTNIVSSGGGVTRTRDSAWSASGTYSVRLTPALASTDTSMAIEGDQYAMRNGMEAGKTYTASGTIHLDAAQTGTLNARARSICAFYKDGSGLYTNNCSAAAPNAAGDTRLSVTFTLPGDAVEAFVRFYNGASTGGGDVYWDALMLTEGSTLYDFRDGSSNGWSWNGSSNVSTSTGPRP